VTQDSGTSKTGAERKSTKMEDMAGGEWRNEGGGVLRGGEFSAKISRQHNCTYRSMRPVAGRGGNVSCVLVAATHRSESAFRCYAQVQNRSGVSELRRSTPPKQIRIGASNLYWQRGPKHSIRAP
jgi:hypothetical protein